MKGLRVSDAGNGTVPHLAGLVRRVCSCGWAGGLSGSTVSVGASQVGQVHPEPVAAHGGLAGV